MKRRKKREERAQYLVTHVELLNCAVGKFDDGNRENATAITFAHNDGDIGQWALSMNDCRTLAAQLLVALATNKDAFAIHLLDDHFPTDAGGYYKWPDPPYDSI
ncbi:MAG TPA: hypothetical protein VHS31_04795 [Tepidisphaeraceae bacterium]|jgi:hypothetical protein|nr:hypothetical protein [Tepidisphaeraceae bacterium]